MRIDVTGLRREVGRSKSFSFTGSIGGDQEPPASAEVDVTMTNAGPALVAQFSVSATVAQECARCLEMVSIPVDVQFTREYRERTVQSDMEDEEADITWYQDNTIDVDDDVYEQVVLALPMKPVCAVDCRGLCPVCGQNLNAADCGCDRQRIDPRLESLRGLLDREKDGGQ